MAFLQFPEDFEWGTAMAAFQIEGATTADTQLKLVAGVTVTGEARKGHRDALSGGTRGHDTSVAQLRQKRVEGR